MEESDYWGFDILQWWKNSSSRFPILAKMIGRVVETYKSSFSPAIIEALVCIWDWLCKPSKDINVEKDGTQFDEIGGRKLTYESSRRSFLLLYI